MDNMNKITELPMQENIPEQFHQLSISREKAELRSMPPPGSSTLSDQGSVCGVCSCSSNTRAGKTCCLHVKCVPQGPRHKAELSCAEAAPETTNGSWLL